MDLKLPQSFATKQDITHVHRELRVFIDLVMQSVMRHESPIKYPPISKTLRTLAKENQIDLTNESASKKLLDQLEQLKETAPNVHVTFSSEPNDEFLQKLVSWFRKEIDPRIVISVGLQPSMAGGVIVRTPSHQFDLSLRKYLKNNETKLREALKP
jgi:F0F1-type ATP synthase delta subunit